MGTKSQAEGAEPKRLTMPIISDTKYLLTEQYRDAVNLKTRINLHKKFSTNTCGWFPWVFDHIKLPPSCKILELGCGPGDLWFENIERLPSGWQLTLSDFSPGMLEKSWHNLQNQPRAFNFNLIDAQSIPYEDNEFEGVIANHMLYHMPDRAKAFAEIRRVLKPGGILYATTVGEAHMQELTTLLHKFDPGLDNDFNITIIEFTLKNGRAQLEKWFHNISVQRYSAVV
jgi:SAM-dependent methyltransferase